MCILQNMCPVCAEVKEGVILIPAMGNMVLGEIPLKDIDFPPQCIMFRGNNIRGVLVNDPYMLVLRWDGSAMLVWKEDHTLCANFKYVTCDRSSIKVTPAGMLNIGYTKVLLQRFCAKDIENWIIYSLGTPMSAVFLPSKNQGIVPALEACSRVSPVFIANEKGLYVKMGSVNEYSLLKCEEYNYSPGFVLF